MPQRKDLAPQPLYSKRWRCAKSLTELMRDVFVQPKCYERCPGYLYLFGTAHPRHPLRRLSRAFVACGIAARSLDDICCLRRATEKVCLLERASDVQRGYGPFLNRALNGRQTTLHTHIICCVTESKVVQKIQSVPSRLPGSRWKVMRSPVRTASRTSC